MKDPAYFFTHIQLTGGVSFAKSALEPNFTPEQIYHFQGIRSFLLADHSNHKLFDWHAGFGLHRFLPSKDPRYVGLVREPISRSMSHYFRSFETKVPVSPREKFREDLTLKDWLRLGNFRNLQTKYFAGGFHVNYSHKLPPLMSSDKLLQKALANMERYYVFVAIMEEFDESVKLFCAQENLKFTLDTTPNYSGPRPTIDQLDESERKELRDANELDVQLYAEALKRFEIKRRDHKNIST